MDGSDVFVLLNERIRAVLLEKQRTETRCEEIINENEKLWNEKKRVEADNDTLYKRYYYLDFPEFLTALLS